MLKTTYELKSEQKYLTEKLKAVNAELEKRKTAVNISGNKPFKRFTLTEMNDLLTANKTAYEWFNDNQDKTIDEYNATHKTNVIFI